MASRAYADSLAHQASDLAQITQSVDLYALVSMMRVISSTPIFESANRLVRLIGDSYLSPNKSLQELHRMADSGSIDALRDFSEACRAGKANAKPGRENDETFFYLQRGSGESHGCAMANQRTMHDALCAQHPEWIEADGSTKGVSSSL
jgi:hypothetical protein